MQYLGDYMLEEDIDNLSLFVALKEIAVDDDVQIRDNVRVKLSHDFGYSDH